jgi:hypothetical protein
LAGTGERLSTQPDLLLVYQPFDQVSSDNSDDENVHRESQNEFLLEHGAKYYQLRNGRPCSAYDEGENRSQYYAFSYKSGTYRDHRFGPEGQTRTKKAKL